jgi:hypothetical protein
MFKYLFLILVSLVKIPFSIFDLNRLLKLFEEVEEYSEDFYEELKDGNIF